MEKMFGKQTENLNNLSENKFIFEVNNLS